MSLCGQLQHTYICIGRGRLLVHRSNGVTAVASACSNHCHTVSSRSSGMHVGEETKQCDNIIVETTQLAISIVEYAGAMTMGYFE